MNNVPQIGSGLLRHHPKQITYFLIIVTFLQAAILSVLWQSMQQPRAFWLALGLLAVNGLVHLLRYYTSLRISIILFIISLWFITALTLLFPLSEYDLALGYMPLHTILVFALLGRRWGISTTFATSILLIATYFLRQRNIIVVPTHSELFQPIKLISELMIHWITTITLFIIMGYVQRVNRESADAAQALRDETELFELITSNVPAHLTYYDTQGRYIFVNSRFQSLTEAARNAVGKKREEILADPFYQLAQPYFERALKGESVQFDYTHAPKGKVERITEIQYNPLIIDGKLQGIIGLATNVTKVRRTESALYEAQRAESLGVVAGGIAHDFNNLLSAILGQASLAKLKLADDHPARPHIERSIDATERASQLTKQMLAYSGRGNFEKRVFDLNALLSDNADLLRVSIPKQVSLHVQLTNETCLHIKADMTQVQQVVMNLILNAAQAIEGGVGNIWVETKVVKLTKLEYFGSQMLSAGNYVCCTVHDDGHGMSAEVQRRIFDPFFTTKENGAGLGLAAVSGIVRGHAGALRVMSEVGVGTTFEILLPLVACNEAAIDTETAFDRVVTGGTILLIDDEQIIADAVEDILTAYDVGVLYANRGEKGIDCYRANQSRIDVVLLDLTMPGMSGTAVFHKLREINPSLPIVISSGYTRDATAQEIIDEGSADFLPKPYNITDLINVLGRYLPQSLPHTSKTTSPVTSNPSSRFE